MKQMYLFLDPLLTQPAHNLALCLPLLFSNCHRVSGAVCTQAAFTDPHSRTRNNTIEHITALMHHFS